MLTDKNVHTFTHRREHYMRKVHPAHNLTTHLKGKLLLFVLLFLLLIGLIITSNAFV